MDLMYLSPQDSAVAAAYWAMELALEEAWLWKDVMALMPSLGPAA